MRSGSQRPTFEVVGDYAYSEAAEVIEMFEEYGRRYYGSQKYEMELFYARNADGSYAANSIGSTKPRQNGKSFGVRDYSLDSACNEGKRVLYSAHHGRTVRAMFKEMCDFIESHADFKEELDYIYKAGGYEGIYFKNGGCIEFQTRTASGGRGGTYDLVIIDEAQELTTVQQEALIPVVSAAQEIDGGTGTQVIYLGTVPGPGCSGTVFRDMHDRAHAGDTGMWWIEWGVQGSSIADIDLDDVETWYACNPAMGRRMSEAAVKNERDTMSPDGFARERLGWWPPNGCRDSAINAVAWGACEVEEPVTDGTRCYAVKFSPDGRVGSMAVCVKPDDGTPYVQAIAERDMSDGLSWFVETCSKVAPKAAQIVVDGASNADTLVYLLRNDGVSKKALIVPRAAQMASACSMFADAVKSGSVCHCGQDALTDSVTRTEKRAIGSGGGWGFKSNEEVDASTAEAAALAYWAAMTTKRKPGRKMVML